MRSAGIYNRNIARITAVASIGPATAGSAGSGEWGGDNGLRMFAHVHHCGLRVRSFLFSIPIVFSKRYSVHELGCPLVIRLKLKRTLFRIISICRVEFTINYRKNNVFHTSYFNIQSVPRRIFTYCDIS